MAPSSSLEIKEGVFFGGPRLVGFKGNGTPKRELHILRPPILVN